MKNFKLLTKASIVGYILLATVLLSGCGAKLGAKKIEELQKGDIIFIKYGREYLQAVVDSNYVNYKIIALRRNNLLDTYGESPWVTENYTYSNLRGW